MSSRGRVLGSQRRGDRLHGLPYTLLKLHTMGLPHAPTNVQSSLCSPYCVPLPPPHKLVSSSFSPGPGAELLLVLSWYSNLRQGVIPCMLILTLDLNKYGIFCCLESHSLLSVHCVKILIETAFGVCQDGPLRQKPLLRMVQKCLEILVLSKNVYGTFK